ncbi:MAG: alcohol dehydrogenase catalytic domain-containing protein, partial [Haliea sp.]|nr:alcohol dehydrogenase catalytic domain-containing protein [Haliea sp.]
MSELPLVRIHAPGIVTMDSVETPEAGPDDVLVAVRQCGICGSDLGYAAMGGLPGYPVPMPLGHELAGVVAAA